MKNINSGDQIFTFFTKQHTFKAINRNLLQSKDNHISNLEDSIIAPMHGIVKIKKIKANSKVKKGDVLFILEAMKMEFSLTSPRDGIIERIFIIDGQQVSDKMKLLSLKK
jgi:biotin carboxyl carrier protein